MIRIIRRLLKLAGRDAFKIRLGFLFGFLESIFSALALLAVFFILVEIDRVRGLGSGVIWQCFIILCLSAAGRIVFRYLLSRFQSGTGYEVFARQRLLIGDMLKRVPMGYFNDNKLGEITSAVTTDMTFAEMYSMHLLDKVVNGYICAGLYSVVILLFDWRIGVIFIAAILISILVYRYLQIWGKELAPKRQAAQAGLVAAVLEYIQGMAVVKSLHMDGDSSRHVHEAFRESRRANFHMEKTLIPVAAVYDFLFKAASCVILAAAPYFALQGTMTYPVLFLLLIASFTIFSTIENMGSVTVQVRMLDASLDRIEAIKKAAVMDENSREVTPKSYDMELKHVSFSYGQRQVIHDVSLTIPQGTMTAIVGPSGSGKTTLCNLIARFWDVQEGEVLLGGINVKEMTCDSLLRNISMVFQKVYLFNDTVLSNIRFGRPGASRKQVEAAAKRACCHDFIMQLPQGYDTVLGEGGSSLSGGEKQRISIARAILKDAPIVILDEATASIDPENERDIQLAVWELTQGKTRIVIAHRLATIQNADQILVVDGGRIVDRGQHDQLIAQPGIYRNFWRIRQKSAGWTL